MQPKENGMTFNQDSFELQGNPCCHNNFYIINCIEQLKLIWSNHVQIAHEVG